MERNGVRTTNAMTKILLQGCSTCPRRQSPLMPSLIYKIYVCTSLPPTHHRSQTFFTNLPLSSRIPNQSPPDLFLSIRLPLFSLERRQSSPPAPSHPPREPLFLRHRPTSLSKTFPVFRPVALARVDLALPRIGLLSTQDRQPILA